MNHHIRVGSLRLKHTEISLATQMINRGSKVGWKTSFGKAITIFKGMITALLSRGGGGGEQEKERERERG